MVIFSASAAARKISRGSFSSARIQLRDIGDVLSRIVTDAELLAEHQRCDLGAEFLAGIRFGPERMAEVRAIESRGMARRVTDLMQCRGVISIAGRKLVALRQRDGVVGQPIESPIATHVADVGTEARQDRFRPLVAFPLGKRRAVWRRRQAFDLLRVEHHGRPDPRPLIAHHLPHLVAVLVQHGLAVRVANRLQPLPLPELDGSPLLALAHLRVGRLRLAIGHPARVAVALRSRRGSSATLRSCRDTDFRLSGCTA